MIISFGLMMKKLKGEMSKLESKFRFLDISHNQSKIEDIKSRAEEHSPNILDVGALNAWLEFFSYKQTDSANNVFSQENLRKVNIFIQWLVKEQKLNPETSFTLCWDLLKWIHFCERKIPVKEVSLREKKKSNLQVDEPPHFVLKIDTDSYNRNTRINRKKNKKNTEEDGFIIEDVPTEIAVPEYEYDPNQIPLKEGRTAYAPIAINNAYSRGYSYYPLQTILAEKDKDKNGREVVKESIEVVCIRSDKTIQRVVKSDLPDSANAYQRIYRLTDGTLITSLPKPSDYATWSWKSISKFINNEAIPSPLTEMLYVIHGHLKSRVWLPSESDYWLLTLIAAASYSQSIYDAVPLVLLNGPAGTGKSEISAAMVEVSANAVMLGTVSASTMIRAIDAASGLCVLDDLEAIGAGKNNKKGNFSEIAQIIKVSYKKDSATKMITNTSTGRQEILNFYGIKIISATLVPDSVLASRMLYVHTKHMSLEDIEEFKVRERFDEHTIKSLVDEMHTWTFFNVQTIRDKYEELFSSKSNRDDEISAPLKVLAELSEDELIITNLEIALKNQNKRKNKDMLPEDVLLDTVERLIVEGYDKISIFQLMMEMRKELDPGYSIDYAKDMPGWSKPEWIGRILRAKNVVSSDVVRKRRYGSNLRVVTLKSSYIKSVAIKSKVSLDDIPKKDIFAFCGSCNNCPYEKLNCGIKIKKDKKVA